MFGSVRGETDVVDREMAEDQRRMKSRAVRAGNCPIEQNVYATRVGYRVFRRDIFTSATLQVCFGHIFSSFDAVSQIGIW